MNIPMHEPESRIKKDYFY